MLACAAAAIGLRLHLCVRRALLPGRVPDAAGRALPWMRLSDVGFSSCLLLAALAGSAAHPDMAALLVTVAVSAAVASLIIEPATTRAAFPEPSGGTPTPPGPRP